MLVGSKFRTVRSCTWVPTIGKTIPLPRRSLLVLGGNSGNIAKHCISSCKGKRISITLRKQPDPDWRPDESELAGKKRGSEQLKSGYEVKSDETQQTKKKALSGSAKRRKKMMKQRGIIEQVDGTNNSQASAKNIDTGNATPAAKKKQKSSDKQARRNAKRLLKKQGEKKSEQL